MTLILVFCLMLCTIAVSVSVFVELDLRRIKHELNELTKDKKFRDELDDQEILEELKIKGERKWIKSQ